MPDVILPASILEELADLKRRIRDLETSPQANRAMLDDGNFAIRVSAEPNVQASIAVGTSGDAGHFVFDEDGVTVGYFGTLNSGETAMFFLRPQVAIDVAAGLHNPSNPVSSNGTLLRVLEQGFVRPRQFVIWRKTLARTMDSFGQSITNSGTYTEMWYGLFNACTSLYFDVLLDLQAGVTSADIKLEVYDYFNGGAASPQIIHQATGLTVDTQIAQTSTVPYCMMNGETHQVGETLMLKLYARVAGGAGNVGVWPVVAFGTV